MRCCRLLDVSLDLDVVSAKLGGSIGGGDDVILGRLGNGGDLALSDEASGLARSRSSLNCLTADLVRVYDDGLIFVEKKTLVK